VAAYYRADARAQEILAALRCGQIPRDVSVEDTRFVYECPISATQTLAVEVEREDYTVLRWQAVSAVEWEADDSLAVWGGETIGGEADP
jgi:hypothetical protein